MLNSQLTCKERTDVNPFNNSSLGVMKNADWLRIDGDGSNLQTVKLSIKLSIQEVIKLQLNSSHNLIFLTNQKKSISSSI